MLSDCVHKIESEHIGMHRNTRWTPNYPCVCVCACECVEAPAPSPSPAFTALTPRALFPSRTKIRKCCAHVNVLQIPCLARCRTAPSFFNFSRRKNNSFGPASVNMCCHVCKHACFARGNYEFIPMWNLNG